MKKGIKESTLNLGTVSKEDIDKIKLELPASTWFIHNQEVFLQEVCYICGTTEGHDYKDHKCWLCWRNTNPGALVSP